MEQKIGGAKVFDNIIQIGDTTSCLLSSNYNETNKCLLTRATVSLIF